MILDIMIPGAPLAQSRARTVRNKYTGKVHSYDLEKAVTWKNWAKMHIINSLPEEGSSGKILIPEGPIGVYLTACFPCTATDAKKKAVKASGLRWHTKQRGDLDNIIKAAWDASKGLLWTDDCQVSMVRSMKLILIPGDSPYLMMKVFQITESPEEYADDFLADV